MFFLIHTKLSPTIVNKFVKKILVSYLFIVINNSINYFFFFSVNKHLLFQQVYSQLLYKYQQVVFFLKAYKIKRHQNYQQKIYL